MQNFRVRLGQGPAVDAVPAQGQQPADGPGGAVNLRNFFIGGAFHGVNSVPAQQFHRQPVEIFRAGPHHDLFRRNPNAPVSGQILPQSRQQPGMSGIGGFFQNFLPAFRQHPAHSLAEHGQGKGRLSGGSPGGPGRGLGRGGGKAVPLTEEHEIAAAFPGLGVALVAQQGVGVFHGDGAQAGFLRQQPLGGQPPALGINAPENIVPQLPIEKQIGGTLVFVDDVAHLV